jgi:pyruvate dehydrogenase E2 component (dihydrolipoamide acetyltransferase)
MATIITMPRLSDTMTEGTVAAWQKVGDKISEGDILAKLKPTKQQWNLNPFMKEHFCILVYQKAKQQR